MALKLDAPQNGNYAAVVKRIRSIVKIPNRDRIVAVPLLGYQAIVGIDTQIDDLVVVFPPETQLSPEFLHANNLYRHEAQNKDPEVKGYFEDNGRVKAIKFAGNRSDCFIASLESLTYTGVDISQLKEDDTFDKLGDHEICKKFVRPTKAGSLGGGGKPAAKFPRVDERQFPKHFETDNWWRNSWKIGPDEIVYVTQKVHGTSVRIGHIPVARQLTLRDRIARRLGVHIGVTDFDHVYGSRNQVLDANNPVDNFYKDDIWTREGKKLNGLIPQGYLVFGELVGWAGGSPIQSKYTYNVIPGDARLLVYRIAHVNPQGFLVDLSWPQVKAACTEWGLEHVAELWSGRHELFMPDVWLDKRFHDMGYLNALPLGADQKLVDEGVCIRSDNGFVPTVLKAKSPIFLGHETVMLDQNDSVDLEAEDVAA
jgi:hypothetical protein